MIKMTTNTKHFIRNENTNYVLLIVKECRIEHFTFKFYLSRKKPEKNIKKSLFIEGLL